MGDGWMSPYHNARYANFLYQTGMIDEIIRDECLGISITERTFIDLALIGRWAQIDEA